LIAGPRWATCGRPPGNLIVSGRYQSHGEQHRLQRFHLGCRPPIKASRTSSDCGKWRNATRIGSGAFFLAMGAINAIVTFRNAADIYES
jgi:hypothetical protein